MASCPVIIDSRVWSGIAPRDQCDRYTQVLLTSTFLLKSSSRTVVFIGRVIHPSNHRYYLTHNLCSNRQETISDRICLHPDDVTTTTTARVMTYRGSWLVAVFVSFLIVEKAILLFLNNMNREIKSKVEYDVVKSYGPWTHDASKVRYLDGPAQESGTRTHTSQRTEDTKTQVSTFPRSQEKKPMRKMCKAEEALHGKLE